MYCRRRIGNWKFKRYCATARPGVHTPAPPSASPADDHRAPPADAPRSVYGAARGPGLAEYVTLLGMLTATCGKIGRELYTF